MTKRLRKNLDLAWQYLVQEDVQLVQRYLQSLEKLPTRKLALLDFLFEGVFLDDKNRLQGAEKCLALPHGYLILLWYLGMCARMGALRLRYLEELDLRSWNIQKFPYNLGELQKLRRLRLKGKVDNIPPRIEEIILDEQTLHHIRPWLEELTIQPKLFLDIEDPAEFVPDLFENVYGIRFAKRIASIPYWLRNYLKIRKLCIPFHTIQKFPYWFSEFSSLEVLEIGGRQHIEKITLPDSLKDLGALRRLTCANFGWTEIPAWIYELKELRYLDIGGNKLQEIPSDLSQLQNLEQLKIEYNPLNKFPVVLNQIETLKEVSVDFRQKKAWKEEAEVPLHLALQASFSWD